MGEVDTTQDNVTDTVCVCKRTKRPAAPVRCERNSSQYNCQERDAQRDAGFEPLPPGLEDKLHPQDAPAPAFPTLTPTPEPTPTPAAKVGAEPQVPQSAEAPQPY